MKGALGGAAAVNAGVAAAQRALAGAREPRAPRAAKKAR
jgi:hypothetical protein